MATDGDIYQKLEEYKKAVKDNNFYAARSHFVGMVTSINSYDGSLIDKLIYKINLLKATEANIINHPPIETTLENEYFQEEVTKLKNYLKYYWSGIDRFLLPTISNYLIGKINEAADEIIHEIPRCFNFYSGLEKGGDFSQDNYDTLTTAINNAIDKGKEKLETIIPLFSIWGAKGEKINEEIKKSKESIKEEVDKAGRIKEDIIEMGFGTEINREITNFSNSAIWHMVRGFVFLSICLVLGFLTIIWALGIKEIFGYENVLISKDIICSLYTRSDFYLCKLNTLPKELLVGAVFFAGIYASLRAYFGNANSEVINRHRSNSLQAFKYLYKVVEVKDRHMVMQKAAEAIFEQLPTGFTKYHKDDSNKSSDTNAQLALIAAALAARATKGGGTSTPSA